MPKIKKFFNANHLGKSRREFRSHCKQKTNYNRILNGQEVFSQRSIADFLYPSKSDVPNEGIGLLMEIDETDTKN